MKILYHHRTLSRDGQSVHIDELIHALRAQGHVVLVAGPAQHAVASFGSDSGWIARLKTALPGALYELLEIAYNIPAFWRLLKCWWSFKPDVLYERYSLFMFAGLWLRRLARLPMLLEVNAPLAEERNRFDGLALRKLGQWAEHTVWRGADRALPVTGVLAQYLNVSAARVVVVPNGVGEGFLGALPDANAAKRAFGLGDRVVLGFVGFMRPWHGLDRVIDFIADAGESPQLHFLLVGEGPARQQLEARAAMRGVSHRVTFAGLVARDRVIDYIAAFDIALQPDVVGYASPLKVFEYMALGRAIVAPAMENITEVLTDGKNALLFDPTAAGSFEQALARLCSDAELRGRLGHDAKTTIIDGDFTWAGNARRIVALAAGLPEQSRRS